MRVEDRYDSIFQYYGWKSGVDWLLLKAQVKQESNFYPDAKSKVGALGLSQFMARTWEEWRDGAAGIQETPPGGQLDPRDPEDAIRAQAAYMAWLLRQFGGNQSKALAAYNWGIGNVKKIAPLEDWTTRLPDETRLYLKLIEKNYEQYRREKSNAVKIT